MSANSHGMIRSAYTFDSDAVSNETALDCGDEAVTQQCFKDECDINILLAKFAVTGQLPDNVRVPQFVDFEEAFDFQSSMNVIRAAEEAFNAMPAEDVSTADYNSYLHSHIRYFFYLTCILSQAFRVYTKTLFTH